MKRAKYGNNKVRNRFGEFGSEGEYARFLFLQNRQKEGEISGLKTQVEYELIPAQYRAETVQLKTKTKEVRRLVERPCTYKADFEYWRGGKLVVEDYKGSKFMIDEKFPIKKKLMLYIHHIEVKVVTSPTFWDKG